MGLPDADGQPHFVIPLRLPGGHPAPAPWVLLTTAQGGGPVKDDQTETVEPDPEKVTSRAEGRPPEESSSSDPKGQAEAVLHDSEDRVAEGSAKSE